MDRNEYSIIYLLERVLCKSAQFVLLLSHFQVYLLGGARGVVRKTKHWIWLSQPQPKDEKKQQKYLSTRCRDNEEEDEDARGESLIKFLIIQMCSVVVGVYTRIHCDNSLIIIFAFNRRCLQCSLHWNLHLHRAHTKCARCPTARTIAVARENRSEEERKPTETNSALIRRYCE